MKTRTKRMTRSGAVFRNALNLAMVILFLTSCKNEFEEYEGSWSGSYIGDDTGSWMVNIDDEGDLSGDYTSDSLSSFTITMSGSITEDGELTASSNLDIVDIVFKGDLNSSKGLGTWRNETEDLSGTWVGAKH